MRTYLRNIVIIVIAVHLGLISWVIIIEKTNFPVTLKQHKQKLFVKTVSLIDKAEKPLLLTPISKVENPPKIESKKKEEPRLLKNPTKTQKKEPALKNTSTNKIVKKNTKENMKTSKMQENLAKIRNNFNKDNPLKKNDSEIADLAEIVTLNIDSQIATLNAANYYDALVNCLKKGLILPEMGEVKVNLTIDHKGKVLKLETLESKSIWNKQYIEKHLPKLTMPSFELYYKGIAHKTFTITLTNEN